MVMEMVMVMEMEMMESIMAAIELQWCSLSLMT
jgi:hypothetical protein